MALQQEYLKLSIDDAQASAIYSAPENATATVVVAHGAGAGMEHPFLTGFATALNDAGVATLRFNFAYREAGRKFPDRPPKAIAAWNAAMKAATARSAGTPVWACGKSFGGRMASMAVAEGMHAQGLIFLGYPLHPPGKPEKLRDAHLYGLDLPMLFVQGSRDTFALPGELEPVVERIGANASLLRIEGGDHSFNRPGRRLTAEEVGASLAAPVLEFLR